VPNSPENIHGRSCDLKFNLSPSYDLSRGFKSLLPRRFNQPKLLTSSLLSCQERNDSNQIFSLDSLSSKERVYLSDLLRAHYKIQNYNANLWNLADCLADTTDPFYLLLSESEAYFDHRWRTLRQTQCRLYPDESYQYFINCSEQWSWPLQNTRHLCEEFPGKLRVLDVATRTRDLWEKKIKVEKKKFSQDKPEPNLEHLCEEGWSLGCFKFNFAKEPTHRIIGEALTLPDAALGLGFGEQVSLLVREWLRKIDINKNFQGACIMGVFDIALSAALTQSFIRHELFKDPNVIISPDLQYGLSPVATVLDALSAHDNFIYVGMGSYPFLNLFYGTKEGLL